MLRKALLLILLAHVFVLQAQFCDDPIGYGRNTTGGTGGTVYTVTNLNDAGAGSLRVGLESANTYIIKFAVTGTVTMANDIFVKSNKTIDADGTYIRLRYYALRLKGVNNVIIRNIHFDSDHVDHGGSGDAITIDDATTNVWVDHCTFEDWFDGTVDITEASDNVTVSWCYFRGHDKVMLIGASDSHTGDAGKLRVTVHHCFFDGTTQRHPRSRFGRIHVYNNWLKDLDSYGIVSYMGAQTYIEKCRFENVPTLAMYQYSGGDGYISHTGNQIIGGGSIPSTGGVFTPSSVYTYTPDAADNMLRDMLQAYVGYNTTTNMSLTVSGSTMTANYLARSYRWYKNGVLISGATSSSYTAPSCGTYSCRLYGDNGCYKELSHTITVGQPAVPSITVLGGNAYFCTGGSVTLRSTLAPNGYAYQWSRNNVDISGATARDYVVTQQGSYRVRLTGACTTANSAATAIQSQGAPDCNGVCGGTAVVDCNGDCGGAAFLDDCSICSGGNTGHVPNSDKDCAGNCFGNAVLDCAGICGGTATVDCSGVCGGTDTLDCAGGCTGLKLDCNGVCGGTDTVDCMGVCGGTAVRDCNGDCNGSAFLDSCGICSGGNTGHIPNSDRDCAGNCFGTTVVDCHGDCGGSAFIDSCGVCSGGNSGHLPNAERDCNGVCGGSAFLDDCGVCSGGTTGHIANSDKDCAGNCFGTAVVDCHGDCGGTAFIDSCGICSAGNTGHAVDADKDCTGLCFGTAVTDCNGVCNGGAIIDSCGQCLLPSDSMFNVPCRGCDGVCNSGFVVDSCGLCLHPSDSLFNNTCRGCDGVCNSGFILDSCGQCLHPTNEQFNKCASTHLSSLINEKLEVKWYPNPANDEFFVCVNRIEKNMWLEIFNNLGQTIKYSRMEHLCTALSLTDVSNGIYFLRVYEEGRPPVQGKFVKE